MDYASLTKEELSVDLAERVLSDILTDSQPRPITPIVILQATSDMFGFSIEEIQAKGLQLESASRLKSQFPKRFGFHQKQAVGVMNAGFVWVFFEELLVSRVRFRRALADGRPCGLPHQPPDCGLNSGAGRISSS